MTREKEKEKLKKDKKKDGKTEEIRKEEEEN